MALAELGRFSKNEANILIGALEAQGIIAVAFDEGASIADGSQRVGTYPLVRNNSGKLELIPYDVFGPKIYRPEISPRRIS